MLRQRGMLANFLEILPKHSRESGSSFCQNAAADVVNQSTLFVVNKDRFFVTSRAATVPRHSRSMTLPARQKVDGFRHQGSVIDR